jgi:hypothetical protein
VDGPNKEILSSVAKATLVFQALLTIRHRSIHSRPVAVDKLGSCPLPEFIVAPNGICCKWELRILIG